MDSTIEIPTEEEIAIYEGRSAATTATAPKKGKGATAEEKKIKELEIANEKVIFYTSFYTSTNFGIKIRCKTV